MGVLLFFVHSLFDLAMFYKNLTNIQKLYQNIKQQYLLKIKIEEKKIVYKDREIYYIEQNLAGMLHNLIKSCWYLVFISLVAQDLYSLYLILFIFVFCYCFYLGILPKSFVTILLGSSVFYSYQGGELMNKLFANTFIGLVCIGSIFGLYILPCLRVVIFIRCFLSFLFIFYRSFPGLQKFVLDNNLLDDFELLETLNPLNYITLDEHIKKSITDINIDKSKAEALLAKYYTLSENKKINSDNAKELLEEYLELLRKFKK